MEEIAAIAERLKAQGLTMLLVEQNYPFASRIADRVYVLGKGRIRWEGTAAELDMACGVMSRPWHGSHCSVRRIRTSASRLRSQGQLKIGEVGVRFS